MGSTNITVTIVSCCCCCSCCHDVFLVDVDVEASKQLASFNVDVVPASQAVQSIHAVRVQLISTSQQMLSAQQLYVLDT